MQSAHRSSRPVPAARPWWFASCMLLAVAATSCDGGNRREARRVVLITCDTLRADRLGMYGHKRDTSRELNRFAAESTVYEAAWCTAPVTVPALSSLHSSLLPHEIGALYTNRNQMPADVRTLAETVRDAGIDTAAFVSNGVLKRAPAELGDVGLQQGFQLYDDEMRDRELQRPIVERVAADTADATLRWLEGRRRAGEDEFFLWVHFQDPHGPYTPPAEMDVYASSPSERRLPVADRSVGARYAIPAYQFLPAEAPAGERSGDPARYADLYDAEIRYFDAHAGRLLQWLRDQGWYEDSLIVFTADHGESLGERGWWFCHGESLHAEQTRVPLVVRAPGGTAGRESRAVSHLDLMPTILDAFGLEAPALRGKSLLGSRPPAERPMSSYLGAPSQGRMAYAISDGRWRLVADSRDPMRLHDLASDAAELVDVSDANPTVVRRLVEAHNGWFKSRSPGRTAVERPMDEDTRRAMGGLGYTDGDGH